MRRISDLLPHGRHEIERCGDQNVRVCPIAEGFDRDQGCFGRAVVALAVADHQVYDAQVHPAVDVDRAFFRHFVRAAVRTMPGEQVDQRMAGHRINRAVTDVARFQILTARAFRWLRILLAKIGDLIVDDALEPYRMLLAGVGHADYRIGPRGVELFECAVDVGSIAQRGDTR